MFIRTQAQIVDGITSLWGRYVVLCNGRLLQKGARKLIGVLELSSRLANRDRVERVALGTVWSEEFNLRLPAFFIDIDGLELCIEVYIDPTESQDDRLRFRLQFTVHGILVHTKSVLWSSKKGPDIIHSYQLLDIATEVVESRQKRILHQGAKVRLERRLASMSRLLDYSYREDHDSFLLYKAGRLVGVISIIDSVGGFISNLSIEPSASRIAKDDQLSKLDAIILT